MLKSWRSLGFPQSSGSPLPAYETPPTANRWLNKGRINFKDDHHGDHFGFPIREILAIFDIQVAQILPTKAQVNWPISSGEEQNRFSR